MNFLAHAHLSEPEPEAVVGNLLGDFVKGRLDHQFPPVLTRGLRLHRAIDAYCEDHEAWRATKRLLSPPRRRFAGLIVDVFYDHFLAVQWEHYHHEPLDAFIAGTYATIRDCEDLLPTRARPVFERMIEQDWLGTYVDVSGIGLTIDRMSRRSPRIAPMAGAAEELEQHYDEIQAHFDRFYPDLESFVTDWCTRA